jgi:hypothetical protein
MKYLSIMKVIITENKFKSLILKESLSERISKLIITMHRDGKSIDDISLYTGINYKLVTQVLKDEPINFYGSKNRCVSVSGILYSFLWETTLIKKEHTYSDGSTIDLDHDGNAIMFRYVTNDNHELNGFATFLFDGECNIPIEGTWLTTKDGDDIDDSEWGGYCYRSIQSDVESLNTYNDIANYFNDNYFEMVKPTIDSLVLKYLNMIK